ncbi:SURF1 family protein [Neopusillimonas aromaticivorans]|uniref:SURF1 family protein n=1 Tax=Neopusillimonas aromaticivorans TaxID=2979868 RepID=UPI002591E289|nr:SURF1 family cytochrome oxidase biogenesis protein [Neopusillimonas aromaticivorans]WJJ94636.1 SURF1 family cytochrome oxidase biogenesis protein [Neopusillimonas aromaticivorans]
MANASFSFRILAAFILLAVVAVVCASLGRWQLGRAAEREAIHARIMAGRQATPLTLGPDASAPDLQDWRAAQVTGQWLNRYTVLLANRNLEGRPGYWVATRWRCPHLRTPEPATPLGRLVTRNRRCQRSGHSGIAGLDTPATGGQRNVAPTVGPDRPPDHPGRTA